MAIAEHHHQHREIGDVTAWVRVVLAAASAAAGVIHLAMVPAHAGSSLLEASGFAGFGWLQIVLAVVLVTRPQHVVVPLVALVNLAALGLWIWSRTTGLPFGAHPNVAEAVTSVDATTAVFEAVATLGAALAFVFPRLGSRAGNTGWALAGALATAGFVASSVVLASPTARGHAHNESAVASSSSSDGHDHAADPAALAAVASSGDPTLAVSPDGHPHTAAAAPATSVAAPDRCDVGFNPSSYWSETAAAGIDTTTGSHDTAAGHDHSAATASIVGSAELDRLIALTTSADGAESKDAKVVAALADVSDQTYENWLKWLPTYTASHTTAVSVDDNGGHGGHLGPQPWVAMTDQAECDQLQSELDRAKAIALQYPTAADATAGGWYRVTGFVPGIAAHYMNFKLVDGTFDIDHPEMLLYDGDGPDAHIVGLSYYLLHDSDFEPTQGFAGPNDHFHRHIGLCVGVGGVIGDSSLTDEECAARGGKKQGGFGGWMNHVWIVPGCESPWGMFSGASPLIENGLRQSSGTDAGACAGSGVRARYDLSPGTASELQALQNG